MLRCDIVVSPSWHLYWMKTKIGLGHNKAPVECGQKKLSVIVMMCHILITEMRE